MAIVSVPDKNLTFTETEEIKNYLGAIGIDYERWENVKNVSIRKGNAPLDGQTAHLNVKSFDEIE